MSCPPDVEDVDSFRARLCAWLAERFSRRDPNTDDDRGDVIARTPHGHDFHVARARQFQRELAGAGFAGLNLPACYGGQGLTDEHQATVEAELLRYDTPSLRFLGIGPHLALPTLLAAGTEDQKTRYLPPLIRGDELWCQLFSEPDAGSDLASLRTRAVPDRGGWIVDGQKVWSSYASHASFGLLLARTDPEALRPQAGLSMFVLPMAAPGVAVRPLVDITGGRHFNEVFLDAVRLEAAQVLGEVNDGWRVATRTLGGERAGYHGGSGGSRRRRQLMAASDREDRRGPIARQRMAAVIIDEWVLEMFAQRLRGGAVLGGHPACGSLMKLAAGTLEQRAAELVADLKGMDALAWGGSIPDGDRLAHALAASRQATIAGGTHQIQRNLVAERLLGLPR
jgi:alkylation response protein AidB-like acyl-CoA dehydrogenase